MKAYSDRYDELYGKMQVFCIDPKLEDYKTIVDYTKMNFICGFEEWKTAALACYGDYWKSVDPSLDIPYGIKDEYNKMVSNSCRKLFDKPTGSTLDKTWYLFFASGNYECLEAAYSVIGADNEKLSKIATDLYDQVRTTYEKKLETIPDNYYSSNILYKTWDFPVRTVFKDLDIYIKKALSNLNKKCLLTEDPNTKKLAARLSNLKQPAEKEDIESIYDRIAQSLSII